MEGEDCVETTEGERVGESDGSARVGGTGLFGDDVEVESGVNVGDAVGEGELVVLECKDCGEGFDGSGGSDGVAVEGFGGADGNLRGSGAEELVDSGSFGGVVGLGSGAVGVDVADLVEEGFYGEVFCE